MCICVFVCACVFNAHNLTCTSPLQSSFSCVPIEQPTTNTMVTAPNQDKPNANQSDGILVQTSPALSAPQLPPTSSSSSSVNLPNQFNEHKKDTANTTISTVNNSSHSKIPVLNPTARSIKCSSWAGNDYPIAPDMNDLTPGTRIDALESTKIFLCIKL